MLTNNLGKQGEDIAYEYLKSQGYKILQKNFRSKVGEIDIIAVDHNILTFIEVKTRWSKKFGLPEEAVTPWKIKSIIRTGEYFKLLHPDLPDSLRIDVIAISMSPACADPPAGRAGASPGRPGGEVEEIKLIKNVSQ